MRLLWAAAVAVGIPLGVNFYLAPAAVPNPASVQAAASAAPKPALQALFVELTPSFTAQPDPFALQLNANQAAPALRLRSGSRELARLEQAEAGIPILLGPFDDLPITADASAPQGAKSRLELFAEAHPPTSGAGPSKVAFLRIRLFRRNAQGQPEAAPVGETVITSPPGMPVAGLAVLTLTD